MGLSQAPENMTLYGSLTNSLTNEEKARMHPCIKAKCVMRSGDSPPPVQASIPSAYDDVPDDAGTIGKAISSSSTMRTKLLIPESVDVDAKLTSIEQAVPVVRKTLPSPEPQPKIEQNGFDRKYANEKKTVDDSDCDDDSCIVKCVYFTQQCCECTIM